MQSFINGISQIDARIRKKGETLPELAQDIKRLVRLAYPNAPVEVRDSLAYRSFAWSKYV
jgi:hypothetical protein